ncbi:hypothetical protein NVP1029O_26 [Vibrio phage 1.029.O._10N.261.55.A7]|nr:hypothetical protein NVP1029O_26 [Vibrio phage 1.029.O._10N.261.55.A7]
MTKLINKDKVDLTVYDGDEKVTIPAGGSADVDGRRDWKDNLFVKAGLLDAVEEKKTVEKTKK